MKNNENWDFPNVVFIGRLSFWACPPHFGILSQRKRTGIVCLLLDTELPGIPGFRGHLVLRLGLGRGQGPYCMSIPNERPILRLHQLQTNRNTARWWDPTNEPNAAQYVCTCRYRVLREWRAVSSHFIAFRRSEIHLQLPHTLTRRRVHTSASLNSIPSMVYDTDSLLNMCRVRKQL